MNAKEKEKFREHINKFSKDQIVGWLSAISFIMSRNTNIKLGNELSAMFDICDEVIRERRDNI